MPRLIPDLHPHASHHCLATVRRSLAPALLALTLPLAGTAQAQSRNADTAEDARLYRAEVAACESGASRQDRAACVAEARSARAERRRGGLDTPASSLQANALARCQVFQPGPDMEACRARVMGQGSVSGSVESGGLLREYAVTIPSESATRGMGASPQPATTAPLSTPQAAPASTPASPDPQTQQQMQMPMHPPMQTPMQPQMQSPMHPDMRSRGDGAGAGSSTTPGQR